MFSTEALNGHILSVSFEGAISPFSISLQWLLASEKACLFKKSSCASWRWNGSLRSWKNYNILQKGEAKIKAIHRQLWLGIREGSPTSSQLVLPLRENQEFWLPFIKDIFSALGGKIKAISFPSNCRKKNFYIDHNEIYVLQILLGWSSMQVWEWTLLQLVDCLSKQRINFCSLA